MLIGTIREHAEHQQIIREMLQEHKKVSVKAEHSHSTSMMEAHESGVSVQPGKTETFVWAFVLTADLEFTCDIPGHYKVGTHGPITFTP